MLRPTILQARRAVIPAVCLAATIAPARAAAQAPTAASSGHELYVSWGYNAVRYTPVDIHFVQSSLGNDFTLQGVDGHDQKGWTDLFHNKLTGVQYSVHIGYFFNAKQDLAIEIAFEHPRFIVTQNQTVHLTGTVRGERVDENVALTEDVLKYKLNNGANILLFNVVKRLRIAGQPDKSGDVAVLLKAGVGFDVPHPTNFVFGEANNPGFQFGGFASGVEGAVRVHVFRRLYLEFAQKGVYARYPGLHIHNGTADQVLWAHITTLSLGTSVQFR